MRLAPPVRGRDSGTGDPSPAGSVATEDEGRRIANDTSEAKLSDEIPAGRVSESATTSNAEGAETSRETLDSHLDVRVSRTEHEAARRRARALGVKPSAWARAVLRDALDERRQEVEVLVAAATVPRPHPELARAVEQVRRVGVNLNQTRRDGSAVDSDLLHDVLAAVDDVRSALGDGIAL